MQEALLAELKQKLDSFQEQAEAKLTMRTWIALLQVWQRERAAGLYDMAAPLHLVFMGKRGTGKTQAGKLIARSYYALDMLSTGNLIRKDGAELREESVLAQAQQDRGNVWMITHVGGMRDGVLAQVAQLLQWENFAVIFADSEAEIERMLYRQPLLRLKICHYFHFTHLQPEQPDVPDAAGEIFAETLAAAQDALPEVLPELPHGIAEKKEIPPDCRDGDCLRAGERLDIAPYVRSPLRVRLICTQHKPEMEIDACVYLLREDELTRCDNDMIFFGNLSSENGSVTVTPDTPECVFRLNQVPEEIRKIAVCFSVYGRNPVFSFAQAGKPLLQLIQGNTQIAWLDLSHLQQEKTLVALELYRYRGSWKLRAVGSGYHDGLEQLCRRYGVEVE